VVAVAEWGRDAMSNLLRVAAVQAAPVFLDREGSVEKACKLIREAGEAGAHIIGFPEGFIPAHPLWYHLYPASSHQSFQFAKRLFLNAVEIPGPAINVLCRAAAEAQVFVVIGVCEREQERIGTMYNTLLFIDQTGKIVGRHRKLVPTLGERLVHAPGDALGLKAYPARGARVGGLLCAENSNPLATYALDAQGVNVHIASWPAHFPMGVNMQEVIEFTSRSLAYRIKAFVFNAVGEVSEAMLEELAGNAEQRAFLEQQGGGTSVIGPRGQILAGPLPPGEAILYTDVSLDDLVIPKIVQDFGGHYNRFDIFDVGINSGHWTNLHRRESGDAGSLGEAFSTPGAQQAGGEESQT
jgi:nitrilase